MSKYKLGIIGGSGLYDLKKFTNAKYIDVTTAWGKPSDQIISFKHKGKEIFFLPRHGKKHNIQPSFINYRANIDALKQLGVTDIISFSAVGSLNDAIKPGMFVVPDQFIDRTFMRETSFFGKGCVAHVSLAHPVCSVLSDLCIRAASTLNIKVHAKGSYLCMEGPQFSTLKESTLYKNNFGCDIIGMTNMPEAKLAREAEICYSSIGMVTDFDCWHPEHDAVDVTTIVKTMSSNSENAKQFLESLTSIMGFSMECTTGCDRALDNAIITSPEKIDASMKQKLEAITGRVWKKND